MVLQADFIKIIGRRTQRGVFAPAPVTDNLCKRTINDFFRFQLCQRLDIVPGTESLTGRHFVIVADKLLSHGHSMVYDFNFIGTEAVVFLHLNIWWILPGSFDINFEYRIDGNFRLSNERNHERGL